jgi:hypothetical protein
MGRALARILTREPASLGAAVVAWVAVLNPSPVVVAAVTVTVGWIVRMLSTPTKAAAEQAVQAADAKEAEIHAYLAGVNIPLPPPVG